MTKDEFFKVVTIRTFFNSHCPEVKRFYHKFRGKDGNGKKIDFSPEDKKAMTEAARKLGEELQKVKF